MIRCRQFCVLLIVLVITFPLSVFTSFGQDLTKIPMPFINPSGDLVVHKAMIDAAIQGHKAKLGKFYQGFNDALAIYFQLAT
jgi:hypothetical protein